ncbi:hypothetical protein [Litoribacillus peritrichatus]|uniref:VWFA domain-containing protein n=1 Tax=Litoribacillus peritrichatus TaxID=718191 RepID=A0ABP7MQM1_9GAMM
MTNLKYSVMPKLVAFLLVLLSSGGVTADDTEIYVAPSNGVKSNVLLLIDTSGSMDGKVRITNPDTYGSEYTPIPSYISSQYHTPFNHKDYKALTRMQLVKDVATDLILKTDKINISLMEYNKIAGGKVSLASEDIDLVDANGVATTKKEFIEKLYNFGTPNWTPLSEAYHEAALYYMGKPPKYHNTSDETGYYNRDGDWVRVIQSASSSKSVQSSLNNGTYRSPIINECQLDNNIIVFTDGAPTFDEGSNSDIQTLYKSVGSTGDGLSASCSGNGGCMDELAYYLRNTDVIDNSKLDKTQRITTYPIGFGFKEGSNEEKLLNSVARHGQDDPNAKAYTPSGAAGLSAALQDIFNEIQDKAATFTAPVVSINAANRLEHREEVYFALFKPQSEAQWVGNIKRYRIDASGTITDVNKNDAVDEDTGFFKDNAKSWWSSETDGKTVSKGGAAENLTANRTVYTNTGSSSDLSDSSNALSYSNSDLTKEMLRIADETDAYHKKLLDWAGGKNDSGAASHYLADPLHSQPVVIGKTLYYGDNMGYLHGINTEDGTERFAFIPQDLLPNLKKYYENQVGLGKVYGLDGDITPITVNNRTYLIVGMRRGGHNYYAVDVTGDTSKPVLKWVINGETGDFAELGQTWSKPTEGLVKVNGTEKQVLIFAGGYDRNQDPAYTNVDPFELAKRQQAVKDAQEAVNAKISAIGSAAASADAVIANKQSALDQAEQDVIDRKADFDLAVQLVADKQKALDQAKGADPELQEKLNQANNELQIAKDNVAEKQIEIDIINQWFDDNPWAWLFERDKYTKKRNELNQLRQELETLENIEQEKQYIVYDLEDQISGGGDVSEEEEALKRAKEAQERADQAHKDAIDLAREAKGDLEEAIQDKEDHLKILDEELVVLRDRLADSEDALDEISGGVKTEKDTIGRAVFVVDAATGQRLWSAGPDASHDLRMTGMDYSFPADLTLGDLDNNGLTDFVVAADVRGGVWRFDFVEDDLSKARGGKIADLGNGSSTNPARFYNRPDVALFNPRGGASFRVNFAPSTRDDLPSDASDEEREAPPKGSAFLTISLGSGYRAHPLTTDDSDKFFSIWDPYVTELPPKNYEYVAVREDDLELKSTHLLTRTDLYDASSNLLQTGTGDTATTKGTKSIARDNLKSKNGWYFAMQANEKVLSDSLTFNGTLFFTAFTPKNATETCGTDLGSNRAYAVNVIDATAVFALDDEGEFITNNSSGTVDRMMTLKQQGIAADPSVIFTPKESEVSKGEDGTTEKVKTTSPILCFGPYCTDIVNNTPLMTTYWLEYE